MTQVLPVGDPTALHVAAEAIRGGDLIGFPTDTVYGVGGDLAQPAAITAIYALKSRQPEKALPVLLASAAQLSHVSRDVPDAAWRLIEAFWPGALTIILLRHHDVSDLVGPASRTIGVRVPADRRLLRLLEIVRTPLASSSANISGERSARDAQEVAATLGSGLHVVLDGGVLPPRLPSTVIDMTCEPPAVLRNGSVQIGEIARVLGQNPS